MRLAVAIFRYFPFGGLQRDMLAMVQEAQVRNHQVTIFCGAWEGEKLKGVEIVLVQAPLSFAANNTSAKSFVRGFEKIFQRNNFDVLIGFNKMPGLDVYFAGDSCFAQKAHEDRNWLYRLTPRARLYLQYENAVFGASSKTQILSLTDIEAKQFARFYSTAPERFHALPPGIAKSQFQCTNPQLAREKIRTELGIDAHAKIILCLGSGFKTKGLDRSIATFAMLHQLSENKIDSKALAPEKYILLVVGADNAKPYLAQAHQLGVSQHVKFLGGRSDIAEILYAADVLLHPAYRELAGNVILEAMLAGKPVVTTDACGFSHYVSKHNMGAVISAPYDVAQFVEALQAALHIFPAAWQSRAQEFVVTEDVFSRQTQALNVIENIASAKKNQSDEWVDDSAEKIIILRDELITHWAQRDVMNEVQALSGLVAREFADRQTLRFEIAGKIYYRKLHRGVGWAEIVKNLLQFRLPVLGAKNEWLALNKLRALKIPSLTAVAYGEQKKKFAKKISFIVTRELAGVVQLDHYFQLNKVSFPEKTILLRKAAAIARAVHIAGINHRDFYLCHFMLSIESVARWRECGTEPELYIIDLHRAQLRHQVPKRWLIKDLSGLYFSSLDSGFTRSDYFRFMRAYWQLPLRVILTTKMPLLNAITQRAIKTYKRDTGLAPSLHRNPSRNI